MYTLEYVTFSIRHCKRTSMLLFETELCPCEDQDHGTVFSDGWCDQSPLIRYDSSLTQFPLFVLHAPSPSWHGVALSVRLCASRAPQQRCVLEKLQDSPLI